MGSVWEVGGGPGRWCGEEGYVVALGHTVAGMYQLGSGCRPGGWGGVMEVESGWGAAG